jgi:hypothetical protein
LSHQGPKMNGICECFLYCLFICVSLLFCNGQWWSFVAYTKYRTYILTCFCYYYISSSKLFSPCPFYSYSNLMVFWIMVYAGVICFIFNSMCWFSNNLIEWNISKPISPLTIDSNCGVHSEYVFDPYIQITFSKSIPTVGLYLNSIYTEAIQDSCLFRVSLYCSRHDGELTKSGAGH